MNDEPSLASDHALVLAALWSGAAAIAGLSAEPKALSIRGQRGTGDLETDEYGCPILTAQIRAALQKAKGETS